MSAVPVRIHVTPAGRGSTLEIDGKPQKNARSATLHVAVGELTTLTVEYHNVEVEVDGMVEITSLDDQTKRFLQGQRVELGDA